jgi:hypothetical protein
MRFGLGIALSALLGCAAQPRETASGTAPAKDYPAFCHELPERDEPIPSPHCGGVELSEMGAALTTYCSSLPTTHAHCLELAQELTSCNLKFWTPSECDRATAAGDMHGGWWHGAVFVRTAGRWRVVKLVGGDVY